MARRLTHIDKAGAAHMVDVGAKPTTQRTAIAEGAIRMKPATLALISEVPPKPHPTRMFISRFTRRSYSAPGRPRCPSALSICASSIALSGVSGNSPGKRSDPRSNTATRNPIRASREAETPPP